VISREENPSLQSVGHLSEEERTARSMVKQATKKDYTARTSTSAELINFDVLIPSENSSPSTVTTLEALYNIRPQYAGHLSDDQKLARAIAKQESKKETNVHFSYKLAQSTDSEKNEGSGYQSSEAETVNPKLDISSEGAEPTLIGTSEIEISESLETDGNETVPVHVEIEVPSRDNEPHNSDDSELQNASANSSLSGEDGIEGLSDDEIFEKILSDAKNRFETYIHQQQQKAPADVQTQDVSVAENIPENTEDIQDLPAIKTDTSGEDQNTNDEAPEILPEIEDSSEDYTTPQSVLDSQDSPASNTAVEAQEVLEEKPESSPAQKQVEAPEILPDSQNSSEDLTTLQGVLDSQDSPASNAALEAQEVPEEKPESSTAHKQVEVQDYPVVEVEGIEAKEVEVPDSGEDVTELRESQDVIPVVEGVEVEAVHDAGEDASALTERVVEDTTESPDTQIQQNILVDVDDEVQELAQELAQNILESQTLQNIIEDVSKRTPLNVIVEDVAQDISSSSPAKNIVGSQDISSNDANASDNDTLVTSEHKNKGDGEIFDKLQNLQMQMQYLKDLVEKVSSQLLPQQPTKADGEQTFRAASQQVEFSQPPVQLELHVPALTENWEQNTGLKETEQTKQNSNLQETDTEAESSQNETEENSGNASTLEQGNEPAVEQGVIQQESQIRTNNVFTPDQEVNELAVKQEVNNVVEEKTGERQEHSQGTNIVSAMEEEVVMEPTVQLEASDPAEEETGLQQVVNKVIEEETEVRQEYSQGTNFVSALEEEVVQESAVQLEGDAAVEGDGREETGLRHVQIQGTNDVSAIEVTVQSQGTNDASAINEIEKEPAAEREVSEPAEEKTGLQDENQVVKEEETIQEQPQGTTVVSTEEEAVQLPMFPNARAASATEPEHGSGHNPHPTEEDKIERARNKFETKKKDIDSLRQILSVTQNSESSQFNEMLAMLVPDSGKK